MRVDVKLLLEKALPPTPWINGNGEMRQRKKCLSRLINLCHTADKVSIVINIFFAAAFIHCFKIRRINRTPYIPY
jgi:hypothetical protein